MGSMDAFSNNKMVLYKGNLVQGKTGKYKFISVLLTKIISRGKYLHWLFGNGIGSVAQVDCW